MRDAGGSRISQLWGRIARALPPPRGPRAATALNAADIDPIISVYTRRSMPATGFSRDSGKFRVRCLGARGCINAQMTTSTAERAERKARGADPRRRPAQPSEANPSVKKREPDERS